MLIDGQALFLFTEPADAFVIPVRLVVLRQCLRAGAEHSITTGAAGTGLMRYDEPDAFV